MNIINNKRIIDVNCTWHNQETLFLGYSSDINSVELHFIVEPELLKKTENNFSYKIVFNRGTIGDTVKDDVTWSATNGLTYVVPPAITHFSNSDAIQGHQGYLQLFVMKGGSGSAATLVASSQKIPYVIADSLDLSATTVEDLGNTLWGAVQDALAQIQALHFDKVSGTNALTNDDSYVPSSKLMRNLLDTKENVSNKKTTINNSSSEYPTSGAVYTALKTKENISNKKTTITNNNTDYPTTKAVKDALDTKANIDDIYTRDEINDIVGNIEILLSYI